MQSLVSIIVNVPGPVESIITQFTNHVRTRVISKLIKGISNVLQKLLKYFNSTAISTSFVLPAVGFLPVIFPLNLNDSESVIVAFGSYL